MKYILTDNTKEFGSITLHQIQAVRSFSDVREGDLGGWIEKEENLSQDNDCWVYDNACVMDNARIYNTVKIKNNATVSGYALICDNAYICDKAVVCCKSMITEDARVGGCASIFDNAHIGGSSRISGNTTIFGRATIWGNACIYGDNIKIHGSAKVRGNAFIKDPRDIIWISPIGSCNETVTAYRTQDGGIEIVRGCFRGSLDEFEKAVKKTHGDNKYGKEYLTLASLIGERFI